VLFLIALLLAVFVLPSHWGVAVVALGAALDIAETVIFIRWSKRRRATVGVEALVGKVGVAASDLWPEGQVRIGGELWRARCNGACGAGTTVVVRAVEGLTLVVDPSR
jgi:membrane-bound serine protease (ClpP class)